MTGGRPVDRGAGGGPRWLWVALVAGLCGGAMTFGTPRIIHVAPDGADTASGRRNDLRGADGPVRTARRAMQLLLECRDGWQRLRTVVVEFGGGVYPLDMPLRLRREDRSWLWAQTIFRARPGHDVRLVAGRLLQAATGAGEGVQRLPVARLSVDLRRLPRGERIEVYQAGRRLSPAREPDTGWLTISDVQPEGEWTRIRFSPALKAPPTERDAWAHGYWFWDWSDQVLDVRLDPAVRDVMRVRTTAHQYGYKKGQRFYLFGMPEALDAPGEYRIDRAAGEIHVWPLAGRGSELVASTVSSLVGFSDARKVRFVGLQFEASTGDAIRVVNCEDVLFDRCRVRNTGGWGIYISGGRGNGVQRSEITDLGTGGVALYGGNRETLSPAGHFAVDNHITSFARWVRTYSPALALQGVGQVARRNRISDAPHAAILFGGNDQLIEDNDIARVCLETKDCGAIYGGRSWTMRGNRIVGNRLADIGAGHGTNVAGVYLDDMLSGVEVSGNFFTRIGCGILVGGGRDCDLRDNTFVDCDVGVHVDGRGLDPRWSKTVDVVRASLDELPYRSRLWQARYPALAGIDRDGPAGPFGTTVRSNLFAHAGDKRQVQITPAAQPHVVRRDNRRVSAPRSRGRRRAGFRG